MGMGVRVSLTPIIRTHVSAAGLVGLLLAVLVFSSSGSALAQTTKPESVNQQTTESSADNETVYVTRTGEKYHRGSCRHLSKSKSPLPLKEAAARYSPCSVCKPPVLSARPSGAPSVAEPSTAKVPPPAPARPAPVTVSRCQATTKKGSQCSRSAQAGSSYCWQHAR
jgi:hypothetical protein